MPGYVSFLWLQLNWFQNTSECHSKCSWLWNISEHSQYAAELHIEIHTLWVAFFGGAYCSKFNHVLHSTCLVIRHRDCICLTRLKQSSVATSNNSLTRRRRSQQQSGTTLWWSMSRPTNMDQCSLNLWRSGAWLERRCLKILRSTRETPLTKSTRRR